VLRPRRASGSVDPAFLLDPFEAAYLRLQRRGAWPQRLEAALGELEDCRVCPRNCGVNRLLDETRTCRTGRWARVSSAFPHFGEEDCLRGHRGSGTIFFGLCNLRCVFCQNWDISQGVAGRLCSAPELAELMLNLQARGCHNINFVTPEHVVPQVIEGVAEAAARGLRLPIVYNTSAYDSVESLRLLDGIVDIYMPDFKFWEPRTAARHGGAKDYPSRARAAIREMHRQVGDLRFGPDGLARRGLLVRHLVMPGQTEECRAILGWLAELSPHTWINIMGQYRPEHRVGRAGRSGAPLHPEIDRSPTASELRAAFSAARELGLGRLDQRA
jgi:putative pyruvate formate lyase activating enzyme